MGYTHYWGQDTTAPKEAFGQTALDVKKIIEWADAHDIHIAGGMGTGSPDITEGEICFNGREPDDYETVVLSSSADGDFTFCKTARMPYDIVVCVVLLRAHHHGLLAWMSSDGGWDNEWKPARDAYPEIFDEPFPEKCPFRKL